MVVDSVKVCYICLMFGFCLCPTVRTTAGTHRVLHFMCLLDKIFRHNNIKNRFGCRLVMEKS